MKTCSKCKEEKDLSKFYKRSKALDGHSPWCKNCHALYDKDRYKKGDSQRKNSNRKLRENDNRMLLWFYLRSHPCVDCGNDNPKVLEFDHRDPSLKSHDVSSMLDYSKNRILEEIEKCDVRCANCHKERTDRQFDHWRNRATLAERLILDTELYEIIIKYAGISRGLHPLRMVEQIPIGDDTGYVS